MIDYEKRTHRSDEIKNVTEKLFPFACNHKYNQ